jgi:hypothetical protein
VVVNATLYGVPPTHAPWSARPVRSLIYVLLSCVMFVPQVEMSGHRFRNKAVSPNQ